MKKSVKVYTTLLRSERTLYAIQDVELPIPLTYRQIGFFFGSAFLIFLITRLPGMHFAQDWWLWNYAAIPAGLTWFFTRFKLDGKPPYRYVWDLILYFASNKIYNRYEKVEDPKIYKYSTVVTYRKGDDQDC